MPRSMVGLLAAVGVAMSALVSFAQGYLVWLTLGIAAVATSPEAVLRRIPGCELIPEASGEHIRWWANAE
jgi:hypothetical protein